MRIQVPIVQESLRMLAARLQVDLCALMAVNPRFPDPDMPLHGTPVALPSVESAIGVISQTCSIFSPDPQLSWIPLTPIAQMEMTDYDVLIVGSGAGGGAVLWRLAEQWGANGKRIGMIEQGDLAIPTHACNLPTMDFEHLTRYLNSPAISKPVPGLWGSRIVSALGGKTLFWMHASPRMTAEVLSGWPVTYEEMNKYYAIAEELTYTSRTYTDDSRLNDIMLNRLRDNGFPEAIPIPFAADMNQTRLGEIHSSVFFSSIACMASAMFRRPFDLAVRTTAVKVHVDNKSIAGVSVMTADGNYHSIRAKTVVLSGGAIQTPRLLLASNIPGRAIGHYLINHSFIRAEAIQSRGDFPELAGICNALIPQKTGSPFQIQIQNEWFFPKFKTLPLASTVKLAFAAFGAVQPRYENCVRIAPGNKHSLGLPQVYVDFSYSEEDRAIIRMMETAVPKAIQAAGFDPISGAGGAITCLMPLGSDFHEAGTCRMGHNPQTSATDAFGGIHDIDGLYVADNSVLPTIGAGNPTLSTIALAIRTADRIISLEREHGS
ncbi:GMC oxidoreductase [Paenibacillus silvisoli]|uniref:GMC oxidoreductase n=1 Tax=Paenibacillus silvisoli TaxID=3110539 RepID=UPI002805E340|nr:GMC oxidoreductase [Paenibacillus silvisoli]